MKQLWPCTAWVSRAGGSCWAIHPTWWEKKEQKFTSSQEADLGRLCDSAQPAYGQSHPRVESCSGGSSIAPHLCSGHIQAVQRSFFMAAPRLRTSPADAKLRRKLKWHKCKLQSSPWAPPGRGWASAAQLQKPVVQRLKPGGAFRSQDICIFLVSGPAWSVSIQCHRTAVTRNPGFITCVPSLMKKRRENKGKTKEKQRKN